MIYGIFHGGGSYSTRWTERDIEEFKNLTEAIEVFDERIDYDPYYPCCDETAEMWIFYLNPVAEMLAGDLYPDKIITRTAVHDA